MKRSKITEFILEVENYLKGNEETVIVTKGFGGVSKELRYYVTRDKDPMGTYLKDQPLLDKIRKNEGWSWDDLENRRNKTPGIGSFLRFYPVIKSSSDPLLTNYSIQPGRIENEDTLVENIVEQLLDRWGGIMYTGPFFLVKDDGSKWVPYHKEDVPSDYMSNLLIEWTTISEEDFQKDVEKFRENNNEYYTTL